jgi:competence protein ComGC
MKKINSSGSSLFLMEIILNILIFSILLTVCLQFFLKARQLTGDTTQLERAVTCCSNAANVYESGDGTLDSFSEIYKDAIITDEQVIVYLDENFIECPADASVYSMLIFSADSGNASISAVSITCYDGSKEIYSIRACSYAPLSPKTQGGDSDA